MPLHDTRSSSIKVQFIMFDLRFCLQGHRLNGYPKVRKGVLFAKMSPFRKKDYPKMRKGLPFREKDYSIGKKGGCLYCCFTSDIATIPEKGLFCFICLTDDVCSCRIFYGPCFGTFACHCSGEVSLSCPCEHFISVRLSHATVPAKSLFHVHVNILYRLGTR